MSSYSSLFINSSSFTPFNYSLPPSCFHKVSYFSTSRTYPITLIYKKINFLQCKKSFNKRPFKKRSLIAPKASNKMTITEYRDEEEENPPPLLVSEMSSRPRRIALFVEPSPFA